MAWEEVRNPTNRRERALRSRRRGPGPSPDPASILASEHRPRARRCPRHAPRPFGYRSQSPAKSEKGRPVTAATSRARTVRRTFAGSIRRAATGSTACEPAVQGVGPDRDAPPPRAPAGGRLGPRERQPVDDRAVVQAAPRPPGAGRRPRADDVVHGGPGRGLEADHGERLRRLDQVEEVVADPGAVGGGGLGGADVHPPVDHHGVHRHDLGAQPPRPRASEASVFPAAVGPTRARSGARSIPARLRNAAGRVGEEVVGRGAGDRGLEEGPRLRVARERGRACWSGSARGGSVLRPRPSIRISTVWPTMDRLRSSEIASCSSTSRSNRSWTTGLGTWSASGRGRRSRPGRVLEGEGGVEPRRVDHAQRVLEVLLGLAGEADDEVGGHRHAGHGAADALQPLEVARRTVRPAHRPEHPVRSRLQAGSGCARRPAGSRPWPRSRRR